MRGPRVGRPTNRGKEKKGTLIPWELRVGGMEKKRTQPAL